MGKLAKNLKRDLKTTGRNVFNPNPVKKVKGTVKEMKGNYKRVEGDVTNYFAPKAPKPDSPTEIPDEEAIARRRNRDGIRRRQAGGRSSTIMSDALG